MKHGSITSVQLCPTCSGHVEWERALNLCVTCPNLSAGEKQTFLINHFHSFNPPFLLMVSGITHLYSFKNKVCLHQVCWPKKCFFINYMILCKPILQWKRIYKRIGSIRKWMKERGMKEYNRRKTQLTFFHSLSFHPKQSFHNSSSFFSFFCKNVKRLKKNVERSES